jgi:hypothetical protein
MAERFPKTAEPPLMAREDVLAFNCFRQLHSRKI